MPGGGGGPDEEDAGAAGAAGAGLSVLYTVLIAVVCGVLVGALLLAVLCICCERRPCLDGAPGGGRGKRKRRRKADELYGTGDAAASAQNTWPPFPPQYQPGYYDYSYYEPAPSSSSVWSVPGSPGHGHRAPHVGLQEPPYYLYPDYPPPASTPAPPSTEIYYTGNEDTDTVDSGSGTAAQHDTAAASAANAYLRTRDFTRNV